MRIRKMVYMLLAVLLCIGFLAGCGGGQKASSDQASSKPVSEESRSEAQQGGTENMNLEIRTDGKTFSAVLYDSPSGRALAKQLPVTGDMRELNRNEKFYNLPKALPTDEEEIGSIHAGDLMLYGSDCLVLFYKDFQTAYRYTKLGRVTDVSGLEEALGSGDVQVTFQ